MKNLKKLLLVSVFVFVSIILTGCFDLNDKTTLAFASFPKEEYEIDEITEDQFLRSIEITVNSKNTYNLKDFKAVGASVSGITLDQVGKYTLTVTYNGVAITFQYRIVEKNEFEAKIGDVNYTTLEEAFAFANASDTQVTITLLANKIYRNVKGTVFTINKGRSVILNLNGYRIYGLLDNSKSAELIKNNGTLIIDDSTTDKEGALVVEAMYDSDPFNVSVSVISNIGDLTINAGSIINDCGNAGSGSYAIDSLSGSGEPTVIINGGLVESTLYRAIRLFCNSTTLNNTLIINGGTVSSPNNNAIWLQNPNSNSNKGTFYLNGGKVLNGGTYEGTPRYPFNGLTASANFEVVAKGGTVTDCLLDTGYYSEVFAQFVAEGKTIVKNADGTFTITDN